MRKKILLVDDMVTVTTLERVVLGAGFDYLEARNGQEAVERARDEQPDLILMDMQMPVMDGLEGLRRLKAAPATRAIPVVMVTTVKDSQLVDQCLQLGCAAFLGKPIDRELLCATVKDLLDDG